VLLLGHRAPDAASRARVGYLPELFRYQPWLTAAEVLALHARLAGVAVPAADRRESLGAVGLADRARDRVGGFSKGMQQRLGLAVALLGRPRLVILDEPTSALDPVGRVDVRSIVRRAREAGSTVFLNSHLLTEVERVCDRVAIVDRGRVLASGRIDDLLGESQVRLRLEAATPAVLAALGGFGRVETGADGWLTVARVTVDRVPDVVAAVVGAGGRVEAVDPGRSTLEDLFLRLVGGGDGGSGDAVG
jgi:ABC-2 type transport system ATP-binding protein